jgi:hypothetical protein
MAREETRGVSAQGRGGAQSPEEPGWLSSLLETDRKIVGQLPNALRIASGFGGPPVAMAGEVAASGLDYLSGEPVSLIPQSWGNRGVIANTLEAGLGGKALEVAAQGVRAIPALGRRVLPWMHGKAETARKGAFEAEEAISRGTAREAKLAFDEEEIARKADATAMKGARETETAERIAKEREVSAAMDMARNSRIKQDLLGAGAQKGEAKGLYELADKAAQGQRLTDVPNTDAVVGDLLSTVSEGHPLRPFLDALTEASGYDIPRFTQLMREVIRVNRPEARRLYEAMAGDMAKHPEGAIFRDAAEAFKQDVGREMVGNLTRRAGPVDAPLNVGQLARGFEGAREGLSSRLPDSELAKVEAFIKELQTPLARPELPPVVGSPVQGPAQDYVPRVFRGQEAPARTFEAQPLEGPLAHPWQSALGSAGLGASIGYLGGNPYLGALTAGAELIGPMGRAMGDVGQNPEWLDAILGALAQTGRVGVDEWTGE